MTNEDLLEEIDRERKWLDEAGYTAYNIDMVFSTLYKNIKSLEQEPKNNIKALGEELWKVRGGITDEKALLGYNMAVAICNKYLLDRGRRC